MDKTNNLYLNKISTNENQFTKIIFTKEKRKQETRSNDQIPNIFISKTKEKIETIQSLQISNSEFELIEMLNLLQNHLYISGWKSTIGANQNKNLENKWNNKLSNTILQKYNEVLNILETNYPENKQIEDFKFLSKKLSFKKFLDNFDLF